MQALFKSIGRSAVAIIVGAVGAVVVVVAAFVAVNIVATVVGGVCG